jgi:uncharacterized membrane protein
MDWELKKISRLTAGVLLAGIATSLRADAALACTFETLGKPFRFARNCSMAIWWMGAAILLLIVAVVAREPRGEGRIE